MRLATAVLLSASLIFGCKFKSGQVATTQDTANTPTPWSPLQGKTCAAIRGNGELIFGHFGSLAKILETYGVLQGIAGGSSASITTFLYESMYDSPYVRQGCAEGRCSDDDLNTAKRLSLLFKSLVGYADELKTSQPFSTAGQLVAELGRLKKLAAISGSTEEIKAELANPDSLLNLLIAMANELAAGGGPATGAATAAAHAVLTNPILVDLVNPELFSMLNASGKVADVQAKIIQIQDALSTFGDFDGSDPRVFFRQGLVRFSGLAKRIGKIGNFYSGYGLLPGAQMPPEVIDSLATSQRLMKDFVNGCAEASTGKVWADLAGIPIKGSTCGQVFVAAMAAYNDALQRAAQTYPSDWETRFQTRLNDTLGSKNPQLTVIAMTSFFDVNSNIGRNYQKAMAIYQQNPAAPIPEQVFGHQANAAFFESEVKFGYWTNATTMQAIGQPKTTDDLKRRKRVFLSPNDTWGTVLSLSPAEPGLAPAQIFPDNSKYSTGGWSDLHPVQILRDSGCDQVIYVTRTEAETKFGRQVAHQLGMSPEHERQLFAVGTVDARPVSSGFTNAIADADVVWCTNWNAYVAGKTPDFINSVFREGYANAPSEIHERSGFAESRQKLASLANAGPGSLFKPNGVNKVGCTPGIGEGDSGPKGDVPVNPPVP